MHSVESRFVTGPSNILFGGVHRCTFQPGNFTVWGSERLIELLVRQTGFGQLDELYFVLK